MALHHRPRRFTRLAGVVAAVVFALIFLELVIKRATAEYTEETPRDSGSTSPSAAGITPASSRGESVSESAPEIPRVHEEARHIPGEVRRIVGEGFRAGEPGVGVAAKSPEVGEPGRERRDGVGGEHEQESGESGGALGTRGYVGASRSTTGAAAQQQQQQEDEEELVDLQRIERETAREASVPATMGEAASPQGELRTEPEPGTITISSPLPAPGTSGDTPPGVVTLVAHTRGGEFSVRLSRPANLAVRVVSETPGIIEAHLPVLLFTRAGGRGLHSFRFQPT